MGDHRFDDFARYWIVHSPEIERRLPWGSLTQTEQKIFPALVVDMELRLVMVVNVQTGRVDARNDASIGEGFLVWRKQSHAHSIKGVAATEYRQHEGTNNSKPLHGG